MTKNKNIYNCNNDLDDSRIEPPGLLKTRGATNPNGGKIKRRIRPEDVIINCSEDNVPEPPPGCM